MHQVRLMHGNVFIDEHEFVSVQSLWGITRWADMLGSVSRTFALLLATA